ncbi:MAG TPA: hypothetical protein VG937_26640 [Polyangiaceae bacterium]|jgi:hypothetical protein|nr:hypothetical protein [Polyangiaceae bacterium]
MSANDDVEARLGRLGASTASLRPSPGFRERTLRAIQAEASVSLRANLSWGARRFMPIALAFALGAVSWAVLSEHALTATLATSFGEMELEW